MPWRVFVTAGVLLDSDGFARDVDGVHHLEANSCFLRPFRSVAKLHAVRGR